MSLVFSFDMILCEFNDHMKLFCHLSLRMFVSAYFVAFDVLIESLRAYQLLNPNSEYYDIQK